MHREQSSSLSAVGVLRAHAEEQRAAAVLAEGVLDNCRLNLPPCTPPPCAPPCYWHFQCCLPMCQLVIVSEHSRRIRPRWIGAKATTARCGCSPPLVSYVANGCQSTCEGYFPPQLHRHGPVSSAAGTGVRPQGGPAGVPVASSTYSRVGRHFPRIHQPQRHPVSFMAADFGIRCVS